MAANQSMAAVNKIYNTYICHSVSFNIEFNECESLAVR